PAAAWVRALLAGHEVIGAGALRRANGAVFLDSATPAAGPLQRRAELEALEKEAREATTNVDRARKAEESTVKKQAAAEAAVMTAGHEAEHARRIELEAGAENGEAARGLIHARRQADEAAAQVERLTKRLAEVEARLGALHVELQEREVERVRSAKELGAERSGLADLEAQQEAAREQRVRWQVEAAQVEARLAAAQERAGDLEWPRQENERLRGGIDAVGPVNALAVEEHAEENRRLEFLQTQRDDLVTAGSSLQQAAREIDQTAKALFLESFSKVRDHFRSVFQTLFGGGECDVRLANEAEPLESEIEIHAAPRGKRTQRI